MHLNPAHQSVKSCVRYLCRAVSTLADIFLVFRTLLNCLKCIIYEDCYKLRKIAEDFDFIETPDKRGMYKYHDKKRAYIEILSFDKIIDDSGKRNRILFEKLGI